MSIVEVKTEESVKVEDRPYQNRVIKKALEAIDQGHKSILLTMPTGAGKTVVAHRLAEILHQRSGWNYGWTCMRRALLEQAKQAKSRLFPGIDYGQYFSTFTHDIPTGLDVLFEDEAQHSAANTSLNIYGISKPKVHIAMTATPFRTDSMKLTYSKVINDAGLRQLVDEGWLSAYHHYSISMDWNPSEVAECFLNDRARWGKSVIFFLTLEDCHACVKILNENGVPSAVVEGGNLHKQEELIEAFSKNELQVLVNVMVLTEGFDAPDLKTAFIRPGSKGPTTQMGGRVFRKHPSKPYSQIVQNGMTKFPFTQIVSPENTFIHTDGQWISRHAEHELMEKLQARTLRLLFQTKEPVMPDYIKRQLSKKGRLDFNRNR